jgi:4a-hydroxytetrahydrobiopterin dehydratase
MELKEKTCKSCEPGTPALDQRTVALLLAEVPGWAVRPPRPNEDAPTARITKRFKFDDFKGAMAFVGRMAALAEEQAHHPDFCVHYNEVHVTSWTHSVGGLSENDFILAAKIDALIDTHRA